MAYRRNNALEMLKLFAAYMVVFLHVPFYGTFGVAVNALARFAVPFFFLVSGFYSYGISLDKIKNRIAHLVFVMIFAILVCSFCKLAEVMLNQGFQGVGQYFKQYLDYQNILNLLLFNKTIHVEYLWYLFAILYVYIIFYFSTALGTKDKLYWVFTLSALCLHLILGEFLSFFGVVIPNYYMRNFALMGIPFFGLGMLASKYKSKLAELPNLLTVVFLITGVLETLFSRYVFGLNDLYIGSVFILFSFVIVFVKFSNIKAPAMLTALTGCNTYIYILHPIVSGVIVNVYLLAGIHSGGRGYLFLRVIHPLVVCVVSTILAYVLNKILPRIENKIRTLFG